MSELRASGVCLDTFLAMQPGEIINAIPEQERPYYRYWRACHLGKVALNILRGRMFINAGEDDRLVFFSDNYDDGPRIATNITTRGGFSTQWTRKDAALFAEIAGTPAPKHANAIVLATRYMGNWPSSNDDPGWGYCTDLPIGFHEIDPYSLEALETMFDVDLLTIPDETGHLALPLAPAPNRGEIVPPSVHRPAADNWYMPGTMPYPHIQ